MQILFECKRRISPKLSIILLDWSCRDSFHILDYLNKQTLPREDYEIIWIEYYAKRVLQIDQRLKKDETSGNHPVIDKWLMMEMPRNIYYHKHLMYNLGILASKGEIVCFCDSDAMVKTTFVENIVETFRKDRNTVLHMDEVRNMNRKFYPFANPRIEEVTAKGCINFRDGKTIGLLDEEDILHTRNYGACMCAIRQDLINIGGSDQHISYLGHICGPYELTFRLVNAGRKEFWHEEEFIYHTWHPGTNGWNNYFGPHDGKNMSTTALGIISSGRILPLVENPAIKLLRSEKNKFSQDGLLAQAISQSEIIHWQMGRGRLIRHAIGHLSKRSFRKTCKIVLFLPRIIAKFIFIQLWAEVLLYFNILLMSLKQLFYKSANYTENKVMPKSMSFKLKLVFIFFWRMWKNNRYAVNVCKKVIASLNGKGIKRISFYGANDVTKILFILARKKRMKIVNIFDISLAGKYYLGHKVSPLENLKNCNGKVLIASFAGVKEKIAKLKNSGVKENNIIRLQ